MPTSETMLIGGEWVERPPAAPWRSATRPRTRSSPWCRTRARKTWIGPCARHGRAFDGGWRDTTAQQRGRVLFRIAEAIRARRSELAELETLNSGKPIVEAEFDIDDAATCFEYYGGLATKIHGEVLPVPDDALSLALKEPIGVAGQIIPWNYPLLMAAWKIAPALCAGCTSVIKPAEQTPLTLLRWPEPSRTAASPPASSTS